MEDAFFSSRFYKSVGAGLRIKFTKSDNPDHMLRLDIAYNIETGKVGISAGVQQYFSVIKNHRFQLPEIYGSEYNYE